MNAAFRPISDDMALRYAIAYRVPVCTRCGSKLITHVFGDDGSYRAGCPCCQTPADYRRLEEAERDLRDGRGLDQDAENTADR